jgi:hypothetical protein
MSDSRSVISDQGFAFLMTRYRTEYAMLELPTFVRRVVIPVVYVVGRVLGKYEKYRDAPEAVASDRL